MEQLQLVYEQVSAGLSGIAVPRGGGPDGLGQALTAKLRELEEFVDIQVLLATVAS
jgi:hypothetical protein